ncbi:HAT transposon superfamily isoform 2 [Hibiscus syriacus]|uniref:HAT transposon superfamily isoform 2 n=1 Tax=Hibiscus syriacus TaxID=106335 RepID=A0A6A3C4E4_HIBSY|nr:HAT transposon superfamily isoform 2 [Hibiscus syriacus]
MIDAVGKFGPGLVGPSVETLKTTWLKRIKSEVSLQSKDAEKEWATTGYASSYFKTTKCLADLFDSVIQDIGPENVVQIIMGNSFNHTGAHKNWNNKVRFQLSIAAINFETEVLREVSGGKPAVGSIYELMTRAKESIRTYYIMDESKSKTFLDIVDRQWRDQLHSPLHSDGAFLNPSIQYNPEVKFLGSIKEDFFKVLEKLLPTPELRLDITNQIFTFTRAKGMFACNLAMEARDTVSPWLWWEQFGDSAPVLQRVAVRILSQVCSTFTFERHWSTFQQIHTEKRNKIDKETLNDVVYINYNLKLARQMKTMSMESDPIQFDDIDMTSEWVEESENPSPTQWLDRFGSALDGGDLNTRQFSAAMFGNDPIFGL